MTDASFAHLRGMKHLQTLFVQSVESTDGKGFAHLAELPALEELVLGTDPTDGMLEHLQGCKQLKRLRLGDNCRFSDRGVAALRLLPVLEDLQVDCSNMDVRFALERLTKIKFGPLKADWLADLKALPQLKILRLPNGVDHRWKKGLDDLKAAKPALTVHFKAFNSL